MSYWRASNYHKTTNELMTCFKLSQDNQCVTDVLQTTTRQPMCYWRASNYHKTTNVLLTSFKLPQDNQCVLLTCFKLSQDNQWVNDVLQTTTRQPMCYWRPSNYHKETNVCYWRASNYHKTTIVLLACFKLWQVMIHALGNRIHVNGWLKHK